MSSSIGDPAWTVQPPSGVQDFVVVRTFDQDTATVRLQSDPLLAGIPNVSKFRARLHAFGEPVGSGGASVVIFHYNDLDAIVEVRRLAASYDVLPVCLGCDLYTFAPYLAVHDLTEVYVMPTQLHRDILSGQVTRPVIQVDEGADPIGCRPGLPDRFRAGRRLLWFGYAESFAKSMVSLMPAIKDALKSGMLDDFTVMVDEHRFPNRFGVTTLPYNGNMFWEIAQDFDYCMLSHLPLDLKLNSYIKSSNKAVTAIMSGMIPIASATPAYSELLRQYGLERFLFASANELRDITAALSPVDDFKLVARSGAAQHLLTSRSNEAIAASFLHSVGRHITAGPTGKVLPPPASFDDVQARIGFRDHVRALVPSLASAIRMRLTS